MVQQNTTTINVSFEGSKDYAEFTGPASDLLTHEGIYPVTIKEVSLTESKERKIPMLKVQSVVTEEGDNYGKRLTGHVFFDKSKDTKDGALARQIWALLISVGYLTEEKVHEFNGKQLPFDITKLVGLSGHVSARFKESINARPMMEISDWCSPKRVEHNMFRGDSLEEFKRALAAKTGGVPSRSNLGGGTAAGMAAPQMASPPLPSMAPQTDTVVTSSGNSDEALGPAL